MEENVDLTALPAQFHDLIPLMEQWSIGDDVERDAKMQAATDEELRQLHEAVAPRFDAINAYLDEHDDEEATPYLGTLAEAAVEAQLDLENRIGG